MRFSFDGCVVRCIRRAGAGSFFHADGRALARRHADADADVDCHAHGDTDIDAVWDIWLRLLARQPVPQHERMAAAQVLSGLLAMHGASDTIHDIEKFLKGEQHGNENSNTEDN